MIFRLNKKQIMAKKMFSKTNLVKNIFEPNEQEGIIFLNDKKYRESAIGKIGLLKYKKEIDLYILFLFNSFFKKQLFNFWYFSTIQDIDNRLYGIVKSSIILDPPLKINEKHYEMLQNPVIYKDLVKILSIIHTKKPNSFIIPFFSELEGVNNKKEILSIITKYSLKLKENEKKSIDIFLKLISIVEENKYIMKNYTYISILVLFVLITWNEIYILDQKNYFFK